MLVGHSISSSKRSRTSERPCAQALSPLQGERPGPSRARRGHEAIDGHTLGAAPRQAPHGAPSVTARWSLSPYSQDLSHRLTVGSTM